VSERTCLDTVLAEYLDKDDRITFKFVIDLALAELATLRAKAEAWDATVRAWAKMSEHDTHRESLLKEVWDQMKRIDQLRKAAPPARGEGTDTPPSEGQET